MRNLHCLMTYGSCQKCGGVRLVEHELRLCFLCLSYWEIVEQRLELLRRRFYWTLNPVGRLEGYR